MAKARGRTATATKADVQLDDSVEHEALTPLMLRLAREYWEIVRARAEEQALPIAKAWLDPYTDVEGYRLVHLVVHLDASDEQARAFHHGLNGDRRRWRVQLDPEAQQASMRMALVPVGLRSRWTSANDA